MSELGAEERTLTSLATCRYVFLAAGSSLKGQSDYKKFEKARALKVRLAKVVLAPVRRLNLSLLRRSTSTPFAATTPPNSSPRR